MVAAVLRLRVAFLLFLAVSTLVAQKTPPARNGTAPSPVVQRVAGFGRLPLSFEPNQGQADGRVQFLSRGRGYSLFLTSQESVFALAPEGKNGVGDAVGISVELSGTNPKAVAEGVDPLPGKSNYYIGNDPRKWRSNIPTFATVRYSGIYPGTDLIYYGNEQRLEYDFVLAPGSDPDKIDLRFRGADKVAISAEGDLVLTAGGREVRMRKPDIYQRRGDDKTTVAGSYLLRGDNRVGFRVGAYDRGRELVIDPQLVFSTFLGGSQWDYGYAVAADSSDNGYIAGAACSSNFPIVGVGAQTVHCYDAFVAKFSGTAPATLLYSTVIGGTRSENGWALAVDGSGNAYLTGNTNSFDFPVTGGWPGQSTLGTNKGEYSGFLAKFSSSGALIYSGYFGGSGHDEPRAIAVDGNGNVYVAGFTTSADLPGPQVGPSSGSGGVFASTNGAQFWSIIRWGMGGPNIQAVAVSPDGSRVYAGTDAGFYYSTDGGVDWSKSNSWVSLGGSNPATMVYAILATNNSHVCPAAAPNACVYIATDRAVFVSTDYGVSWQYAPQSNQPAVPVRSLTIDPLGNLYAGTNSGIYQLAPQGTTWTHPYPTITGTVWSIVADPTTGTGSPILYAGAGNNAGANAVWKSTDGGATWATTSAPQTTNTYTYLAHDPAISGTVYAISGNNIYVTTSGGNSWNETGFSANGVPAHSIAVDPINRNNLYVASDGGVYTSNAGTASTSTSWVSARTGLLTFADYAIAVNPANPANVYVGTLYRDGFVTQFNSTTGAVQWSEWLGGSEDDQAWSVAVDGSNNVHVAGQTYSGNFPNTVTGFPWQGVTADAFVTILNSSGTMLASRFLGGSSWDTARAIAVDPSGNSYVTGTTYSSNFPVVSQACTPSPCPAFQQTFGGGTDAFVTKLDSSLNIVYSTYLGGTSWEDGNAIAVESATGKVIVAGKTWSTNFPLANPYQPYLQTGPDAFLAKLNNNGDVLIYSTLLGGAQWDEAFGVAEGPSGDVYVGGYSMSGDFPMYAGLNNGTRPSPEPNASAWLTKFAALQNDSDVAITSFTTDLGANPAVQGSTFNYVIQVTNNGPNPLGAPNVMVTLQLSGANWGSGIGTGAACNLQWNTKVIRCSVGTVANGATATITMPIIPQSAGTLTASAYVSTDDGDPNSGNNGAGPLSTTVNGSVGVRVVISHPDPVVHGYPYTETIQITNLYDTITAGSFQFNMPPGTAVAAANSTNVSCTYNGSPLYNQVCTFGAPGPSLGTGQTLTAYLYNNSPTTNGSYPVSLTNVTVTPQNTGDTIQPPQGTMTDIVNVVSGADLAVTIMGAPTSLLLGATTTSPLTVTVTNNGPDPAYNVAVSLPIPAGMYVSASVGATPCTSVAAVDHTYDNVTCTFGTLGVTNSATASLALRGTQPGYWTIKTNNNIARAADGVTNLIDPNSSNNKGSVRIQVKPSNNAVERVILADRANAKYRVFPIDSGIGVMSELTAGWPQQIQDIPYYSGSPAFLSPNGRLLIAGRSVVDATLGAEVARIHVRADSASASNSDGSRLVYAEGSSSDMLEIINTATFDIVSTIDLNGKLGDNASNPYDTNIQGIAIVGDRAYINPAGNTTGVYTVDLSTCWNGPCTVQPTLVPGTAIGYGMNSGARSMALTLGRNGAYVLAVRRTTGVSGQGGVLLILDNSQSPPAVMPTCTSLVQSLPAGQVPGSCYVSLPYVPYAIAVTQDPSDPNRSYAYIAGPASRLMVVDLNTPNNGSTFGQIKQNLAMSYGNGTTQSFSANRVALSADGTKLYVSNISASSNNNLGALNVAAVVSGGCTATPMPTNCWPVQPFHVNGTNMSGGGQMTTLLTGFLDTTPPSNAPVVTSYIPEAATNTAPINVTINGSGFSTELDGNNNPTLRVRWGWLNPIVPTFVNSAQIQFQLPAGTPAQSGDLIVTNTNLQSPVVQQVMSAAGSRVPNLNPWRISSPTSFAPAHPLVFYNAASNSISIAGRNPFALRWNYNDHTAEEIGTYRATANGGPRAGLSPDGSRFYTYANYGNLEAIVLDCSPSPPTTACYEGTVEQSIAWTGGSNTTQWFGNLAPDPRTVSNPNLIYMAASTVTYGVSPAPATSQIQLIAVDTNPAHDFATRMVPAFTISGAAAIAGEFMPEQMAITPDGHYAYVTFDSYLPRQSGFTSETDYLVVFDLVAKTVINQTPLVDLCAGDPYAPAVVSPDGAWLLLSSGTGTAFSCLGAADGAIATLSLSNPVSPTWVGDIIPSVASLPAQYQSLYPSPALPYLDSYVVSGNYLYAADSFQNLVMAFNFSSGNFSQLPGVGYQAAVPPAGPVSWRRMRRWPPPMMASSMSITSWGTRLRCWTRRNSSAARARCSLPMLPGLRRRACG